MKTWFKNFLKIFVSKKFLVGLIVLLCGCLGFEISLQDQSNISVIVCDILGEWISGCK